MTDISEELRKEIIKAIEGDTIPNEDYYHSEDFHYGGRVYTAYGTLKYKGNTYDFIWNHDDGIFYSSIELKEGGSK